MSAAPTRHLTAEEFAASSESEGFELVHGVPEEVPMGAKSSWLGGEIARKVGNFLEANRTAIVFPQDTAIRAWPAEPDHFRKPDVTVVPLSAFPGGELPDGLVESVPSLVVEVVSPTDDAVKLEQKLQDYRRAGIPLVWVIYPETRSAYAFRGEKVSLYEADGFLDASPALPGFTLDLGALFGAPELAASPEAPP